ncbi:MAG TPA: hypothetical protein VKU60_05880, partial [Chloroflexota bacterium]|nr:hypothetical protein [Chloroflexota bacterium]
MASATLSCRSGRGQGEGIHFDPIGSLPHTVLLVLIVLLYLVLALAYARATPAWQAPDEPAHFNYVRELAETGDLPVLEPGAYPASVVPLAPSARPTDISAFQYEAHQPPLFYALAALAYKLNPSLFAVRALSVLFGALLLPVAFWCSRLSVPQCPWLWLAASAFVAFIPVQLFDAGSAENDTLGELITSLLLLVYLALVSGWSSRWRWAMVGGLAGLAVLTKVNIYPPTAALVI